MKLDNYTVREAMLQTEVFLKNTIMNTVLTISMETLVKTQTDELLKKCIESLDLAIIRDKEILKAAGNISAQRMRETMENEFQKEFMKCASRNNRTVYLMGDVREQVDNLQEYLADNFNKVKIAGTCALAECDGDFDSAINEINIAEPDIILSVVPTPKQEYFLKDHKEKLNAKIWYGLGEDYNPGKGAGFARKLIQRGKMHSMLLRYKKNEEVR